MIPVSVVRHLANDGGKWSRYNMFSRKLGDFYRSCVKIYDSLRMAAPIYALAGSLALLALLALGVSCSRKTPGPSEAVRKPEIAMSVKGPGAGVVLLSYDGKGYSPIFEKQRPVEGLHNIAIGDIDGDGVGDVVACSEKGAIAVRYKDARFVSTVLEEDYALEADSVAIGDAEKGGGNEILVVEQRVGHNSKLHVYRLEEGDRFGKHTLEFPRNICSKVGIADVDGDGIDETLLFGSGITVGTIQDGEYRVESVVCTDYGKISSDPVQAERQDRAKRRTLQLFDEALGPLGYKGGDQLSQALTDNFCMSVCVINGRDIDGNGSPDILLQKMLPLNVRPKGGIFDVISYRDGGYVNLAARDGLNLDELEGFAPGYGCFIGDANNDGRPDVVVAGDRIIVFTYDGKFHKFWESEIVSSRMLGTSSLSVADCDGDGLNEITCSVKYSSKGERMMVYENTGRGKNDFHQVWQSDDFPKWIMHATGDIDGK